jgi:nucleoside 2-deoxyribosyltransferase
MRVYLAGPINNTTDAQMHGWRDDLNGRMPRVEFVDPTVRDYRGTEDLNVAAIVENDKDDIDTCEVVVAYCPFPSVGTSMEVLYAWQQGKRVLIFAPPNAPVSPWLRYHSHAVRNFAVEVESQLITWELGCSTSPTRAVTL